mmetsp:Transcript_12433/g.24740  ORF Transcript_12433/g.24740 Transcript_12433/m.24740 type:complete len:203 (-) Transcript_12433:2424-3032(-)
MSSEDHQARWLKAEDSCRMQSTPPSSSCHAGRPQARTSHPSTSGRGGRSRTCRRWRQSSPRRTRSPRPRPRRVGSTSSRGTAPCPPPSPGSSGSPRTPRTAPRELRGFRTAQVGSGSLRVCCPRGCASMPRQGKLCTICLQRLSTCRRGRVRRRCPGRGGRLAPRRGTRHCRRTCKLLACCCTPRWGRTHVHSKRTHPSRAR